MLLSRAQEQTRVGRGRIPTTGPSPPRPRPRPRRAPRPESASPARRTRPRSGSSAAPSPSPPRGWTTTPISPGRGFAFPANPGLTSRLAPDRPTLRSRSDVIRFQPGPSANSSAPVEAAGNAGRRSSSHSPRGASTNSSSLEAALRTRRSLPSPDPPGCSIFSREKPSDPPSAGPPSRWLLYGFVRGGIQHLFDGP